MAILAGKLLIYRLRTCKMSQHHTNTVTDDDAEFGAGGPNASFEESSCGAAVEKKTESARKGACDAATVDKRKRTRNFSHETTERLPERSWLSRGTSFSAERDAVLSVLTRGARTTDSEDERAGGDNLDGVVLHGAPEEEEPHVASREVKSDEFKDSDSDSYSAAVSAPYLHVGAGEEADSVATLHTVAVCVPVMFTTAAGRPICVRETRLLDAKSPFWQLLSFNPERRAALAPASSDNGERADERVCSEVNRCSLLRGHPPAGQAEVHLSEQHNSRVKKRPLSSSRLGEDWLQSRTTRAASCPERCHCVTRSKSDSTVACTLPAFTGFCAANGQPFFTRPRKSQ